MCQIGIQNNLMSPNKQDDFFNPLHWNQVRHAGKYMKQDRCQSESRRNFVSTTMKATENRTVGVKKSSNSGLIDNITPSWGKRECSVFRAGELRDHAH